jgi:hypothetical protein
MQWECQTTFLQKKNIRFAEWELKRSSLTGSRKQSRYQGPGSPGRFWQLVIDPPLGRPFRCGGFPRRWNRRGSISSLKIKNRFHNWVDPFPGIQAYENLSLKFDQISHTQNQIRNRSFIAPCGTSEKQRDTSHRIQPVLQRYIQE